MHTLDPKLHRRYDHNGVLHWTIGTRAMCSIALHTYIPCESVLAADGDITTCVWCLLREMRAAFMVPT